MSKRTPKPIAPATMSADAIGFVCVRPDRPERLAFFTRDGVLSNSFAQDDTLATVGAALAAHGLRLLGDGSVVR